MAKVTIAALLASTVIVLAAFGQGMGILRGGDVAAHLKWALAALIAVLVANFIAIVHAASSARIIRALRARTHGQSGSTSGPAGDGGNG